MMDFESAIADGARAVFYDLKISHCGFHFFQAVRRWLQRHKFGVNTVQLLMSEVQKLYHTPEDNFRKLGSQLVNRWMKSPTQRIFAKYFIRTWFGTTKQVAR